MAKKHNIEEAEEFKKHLEESKVSKIALVDEMKKSFIAYAMAVNVSRAIPDVRDGLKPVHRRILYAMGEDLGLFSDKPHRKCARIVGEVLGKYHPHGDSAVYDALVRLAQDFSIRYPLVDGHGNFGSVDGDPPAAQRYTEARLAPIASEMLRDIEKQTVDFYPNFDDSEMQPVVLPSRFPNLLVNGSDGIAVGMATNIPPHNLDEVINGTIALMENPEITVDELMKYIPSPDYPTGGILMGGAAIRQAYRTGRGGIVVRAKTEIEEYQSGNTTRTRIVVTELPYQVNKARLIENIADLVKEKRIDGISDIREESDRQGMRLVIEVKRDFNAQVVLNTLFKHTQLQVSSGIILLALKDGEPKILNLKEILEAYVAHQREVVTRRTRYDLEKAEERAHILEGLVIALTNIDEVIEVIKKSADRPDAIAKLTEAFELSEKQAIAVLETRLQRLTSLEVHKIEEELAQVKALIAEYREILSNEGKLNEIIKGELTVIKEKYSNPRRTTISMDYSDIDIADLIAVEDIVISLTNQGYIKRMALSEYKAQNRGGMGVIGHKAKEEDFVKSIFLSSTHDDVLFFTSFGRVYNVKGYEIPEADRTARGRAIINLLQLSPGEAVSAVIPLPAGSVGYMVMATQRGVIKKTPLTEFESIRKSGKIAIDLDEGDQLISVELTDGKSELIAASHEGKCIRFREEDVRSMGRNARGVRLMHLDENDYMVDMVSVKEGCQILTITERGYGKRSNPDEYRLQGRGGKGIKAGNLTDKTGKLVCLKTVDPEQDDIILMSDTGIIIRVHVSQLSLVGRSSLGVIVMRLKDEGKVVSVAVTPFDREEEAPAEHEELTDGEAAVQEDGSASEGEASEQAEEPDNQPAEGQLADTDEDSQL